jgi:hypothetical protein
MPLLNVELDTTTQQFTCEFCGCANRVEFPPPPSLLSRPFCRCGRCEREQTSTHGLPDGRPLHQWIRSNDHWTQCY